jgi:hypothetical protein
VSEFIPSGYISIREALNRLGRRLFPSDWTGEEHRARRGLISKDEWSRIKDLPPARGGNAPGAGRAMRGTLARPVATRASSPGDPSSAAYQAEYRANERYRAARDRLWTLLEGGDLEAAILDPFSGRLHRASASLWRRHNAGRMIEEGQAPIPDSPNTGRLWVKQFDQPNVPACAGVR